MSTAEHTHHEHGHASSGGRALLMALALTGGFALVELVGGLVSGSLALIGDAGHMVTDSVALGLGALAAWLSRRPPSRLHSFGLQRAEIVGALANAGFMLVVVAWIAYEAVARLLDPQPVRGAMVLVVAAVGLAVNLLVLRIPSTAGSRTSTPGRGPARPRRSARFRGRAGQRAGHRHHRLDPVDPLLSLLISGLILESPPPGCCGGRPRGHGRGAAAHRPGAPGRRLLELKGVEGSTTCTCGPSPPAITVAATCAFVASRHGRSCWRR
ncbi:MAG: cation diffusion facilitator family transporter [Arhodomonas sp.]|nr:cation diffusion facilitator family transporter [Arhodomonas sp.]